MVRHNTDIQRNVRQEYYNRHTITARAPTRAVFIPNKPIWRARSPPALHTSATCATHRIPEEVAQAAPQGGQAAPGTPIDLPPPLCRSCRSPQRAEARRALVPRPLVRADHRDRPPARQWSHRRGRGDGDGNGRDARGRVHDAAVRVPPVVIVR
jgi:hypothetical protein